MRAPIQAVMQAAMATLLVGPRPVRLRAQGRPSRPPMRLPVRAGAGAEEKVLNVYNWSDYIDPAVIEAFQKETGITVSYDVFDSNEVLETKLLTGNSGYDVVVPSAYFLERQIQAGVFRKLDRSLLPNLANLDPGLQARIAAHDPGNEHGVIYMWGTTGIGFDADKVAAIMPDAPIDSWDLVFDPAVVSKFKDCGVVVPRRPDRHGRHGAALARQGSEQPVRGRPEARRGGPAQDPALHPHHPQLAVHRGSRQRRDLHRRGLQRRRAAGARPGRGGGQGDRHPLRDPARGRAHVVRHARDPGRRRAPGQRARVHQLPAAARGRGGELQLRQLRDRQHGRPRAGRTRNCATTRASTRRPRSRSACSRTWRSPPSSRAR